MGLPESLDWHGFGNRLVKESKSPTRLRSRPYVSVSPVSGSAVQSLSIYAVPEIKSPGTVARLVHRVWSGEWRLACRSDYVPSSPPPLNSGARETSCLSARAVRALSDSGDFVARSEGGYSTFVTLTLDEAARLRVSRPVAHEVLEKGHAPPWGLPGAVGLLVMPGVKASGQFSWVRLWVRSLAENERPAGAYIDGVRSAGVFCPVVWRPASSVQREASRWFDTISKMRSRGWCAPYLRARTRVDSSGAEWCPVSWLAPGSDESKIDGVDDPLQYCWVAEAPLNDVGEANPHVHVLFRWRVSWELFPAWKSRLERAWGQGFAHIEKIKKPSAASAYLMKAIGYLTKGSDSEAQGFIRGNRYGISRAARAPDWEHVCSWAWGHLSGLLDHAREQWQSVIGPIQSRRDCLSESLAAAREFDCDDKGALAQELFKLRKSLRSAPCWFGRYSVTFACAELADMFVEWCERNGWRMSGRPVGLWLSRFRSAVDESRERESLKKIRKWTVMDWWHAAKESVFYETFERVEVF